MDPEERELTVLITKLNANLQIQLAETLGLLAVSIAAFIASYQFLAETSLKPWNIYLSDFLLLFALTFMFFAIIFQQKLNKTIKKIRELK